MGYNLQTDEALSMNIVILGGGSAGWLAAAYLSQTNKVEIKLPKNSKPIGVGESTLPGLVKFFDYCGISEDDVINKCDGVIKYGIKHHGWHKTDWTHPFPNNMHAYHLDALKMIILLEEITRPRLCKVDNPDLIIDCTGFNSDFSKNKQFGSYKTLSNNMALFAPGDSNCQSITNTFAMDYGWMWNVDLRSRSGNGYVFNNNFISVNDAIEEFKNKNVGNVKAEDIHAIPFNNRYCLTPWLGNTVSVGLSCGFAEPLEATGLFLITWAIETIEKLKYKKNKEEIFNRSYVRLCQHVYDFLELFYTSSKNDHTEYWRSLKKYHTLNKPKYQINFFRENYSYKFLNDAAA